MKLEKKTMATLLVVLTLAIAGVMTALAAEETDPVGLTVEVVPKPIPFSITASPGAVTFPSAYEGQTVDGEQQITITIAGDNVVYPFDLSAVLDETEVFYEGALSLDVDSLGYILLVSGETIKTVSELELTTVDLQLLIPSVTPNTYTGTLVFWADLGT